MSYWLDPRQSVRNVDMGQQVNYRFEEGYMGE